MNNSTIISEKSKSNASLEMVDSFGRVHNYLRISLTERCNLRCTYCMPEEGIPLRDKSHFMTHEEIFAMAKIFTQLGVNKIRLTGGEPLIRKGVDNIIKNLGSLNTELAITTNGILVDKHIESFKQASIQSVNVSLDSLIAEKQKKISRRDYFHRILNNIDLLVNENFKVKVNVVVMKGVNDDELSDFVELTKNKELHIRFIEFMPFNGNRWDWSKGVSFKSMMDRFSDHFGANNIVNEQGNTNDTAKCFSVKGYRGTFGIISSVSNPFCSTCNRIRLTADGKIKNCLFSSDETDLLQPFRRGEDIVPLILNSINNKKAQRAGMDTLEDLHTPHLIDQNRSMISIGG